VKRFSLVTLLILASLALPHAQGSLRIPIRQVNPATSTPPDPEDPPQSITITDPAQNHVTTDQSTVTIAGSFTPLITAVTWENSLTMDTGDAAINTNTGTFTVQAAASATKFQDAFTRATSVNISSHTPTLEDGSTGTGKQWDALRSDGGRYCEARSSDYVQPDSSDTGGTAAVICEAVPSSAVSGTNYDLSLQLATGLWSIGSTSNTALMFSIVDVTASSEDYCFLELFVSTQNPDARLVKVVAGTPTVLDSDNIAPANGQTWTVEARGNAITAKQDGVERLTATDADCARSTRVGIGYGAVYPGGTRVISTGARVDNFRLDDPDAGTSGIPLDEGTNVITVEGCEADAMTCYTAIVTFERTGGGDTEDPSGTVVSPTSQLTYATDQSSIIWSGTYSDNVGVASVVIGCAECTPTSSTATLVAGTWTSGAFTMATGANNFIVTITDTSANDTVLPTRVVTLQASADTTPPTVTITGPNGTGSSTHTVSAVTLSGTASDDVAMATTSTISYSSNGCGTGSVNISGGGTSISWSINLTLTAGCTVSVTSRDAAGNISTADTHAFEYNQPLSIQTPPSVTMVEEQAVTFCFTMAGGTSPYTVSKLSGTYPSGITLTANCLTGTPAMGSEGSYTGHSYRVTDDDTTTADTGTFTITVSTGDLGGQNHGVYDAACAMGAQVLKCASMRNSTDINAYKAGSVLRTNTTGDPLLSYDPDDDAHAERQDAMKYRFPGFIFQSPVKTLAAAMSGTADPGSIELINFLTSRSSMSEGRPIKIGNEIMVCIPPTQGGDCLPTGTTTGVYVMRGAYGTSVEAHAAGDPIAYYVNANQQQFTVPWVGSTTSSETVFMGFDVYFTSDFANLGRIPGAGRCSGVHNTTINTNESCTVRNNGFKAFQLRSAGSAITWEAKITTNGGRPSLIPPAHDSDTGGDVGYLTFRHYTTAGQPYYGADNVRPPTSIDWIFTPSKWVRVHILVETNDDANTAAFATVAPLSVGLNDSETTISLDMTNVTVNTAGEGILDYHILGNYVVDAADGTKRSPGRGRRIRIDSEIMALEGCTLSAKDAKTAGAMPCIVNRGVDGTTPATHSAGADVETISDYYSIWISDETHDPELLFDRIPTTRHRDKAVGLGVQTALAGFNFEMDDSGARMTGHRHEVAGFGDLILYFKDFWAVRKAGTGGAGGGALPMEWSSLHVKPTANGN
jgi:hypothetical protein